ncbi:M24 family metallopeptidase [Bacillus atrophaeus]|uniref:M24 family metallopeptidase n=1 Tax=Bacillus atrophaeus TaxID=1452 RepID=UPI00032E9D46|nr:Xaa-Pro peptidase family protein [Bacillus atrophaeus]AKL85131.1 YqhT [Bacillus atrophaeus UCMB-5137]MBJ7896895.1 aminopeptidase P family protein [Bacillus atrophaeus]MED1016051.1 Xaa-Pro peptidase family protein [Bacillus atrophaeus]MED1030668.1 Xaa-Pro peptidase family protein [Bacillus atrophaeus]MED1119866.1 Xaa-Pro peptidase family protein [Bacillus atrophaeus]
MKLEKLRNLFKQLGIDGLLITSGTNLQYMTGFTGSAGLAVISEERAAFITDFRYTEQAKAQVKGFEIIEHGGSLIQTAADTINDFGIAKLGFEQNSMTYGTYASYHAVVNSAELVPVAESVEKLRLIKSDEEIKILEEAAKIADDAFHHILTFIKPGISEISVANELEFFMRSQGADSSSFDMIVASGLRSSLPHGVASEKLIESGDFVTLDFGAYYKGYCSDITRTIAVGEPSDKLKDIYQIVFDAQVLGVQHIKPGMTGKEADALTRDHITAKGYGQYFGHSTGHGLGMEVHESPGLSARSSAVLEPGMIVTVEPGIYIPETGGVRIEDDIVITENGCRTITHSPKELIIL